MFVTQPPSISQASMCCSDEPTWWSPFMPNSQAIVVVMNTLLDSQFFTSYE